MTCIAAVVGKDGTVWMGGDSAGIDSDSLDLGIGKETKVWAASGLLFGACGSFRVSQVLRWHMTVPDANPVHDPLQYITGPLVDAMRNALQSAGALTVWEEDATESMGGGLLIAYQGRVFEMWGDFGVGELIHDYGATGCGGPVAVGSLATTEGLNLNPKRRVQLALDAAERHNAGVRGPMVIIKQGAP
jgi:hypothetical protein